MTWSKLSDDYSDDCWRLSDAAFRLHTEAIIWSNRKLLDCRIPKDDLPRFAKRPEVVPELLDAEWWDEDDDCYILRHHARYQRLAKDVLKQQEANRRNGQKGGRPSREIVPEPPADNPVANPFVKPVENQKGQDRTGQEHLGKQPQEEVWDGPNCRTCGRPLMQQDSIRLGLCEPCSANGGVHPDDVVWFQRAQ